MSYTHPSIPSERELPDVLRRRFAPVREILEAITGRRPGIPKIEPLQAGATNDEIVAKINEIIGRLQA